MKASRMNMEAKIAACLAAGVLGFSALAVVPAARATTINLHASLSPIISGASPVAAQRGSFVVPGVNGNVTADVSRVGAHEGIVQGASWGHYAAPITGSGAAYGGNYFSTGQTISSGIGANYQAISGASGTISFTFANPQTSLDLLWGSVDYGSAGTNVLSFYDNGAFLGSITGKDVYGTGVLSGRSGSQAWSGSQAYGGSAYLNVSGLTFDEVVAGSTMTSFEFALMDPPAGDPPPAAVPEPNELGVTGLGLLMIGMLLRLRQSRKHRA